MGRLTKQQLAARSRKVNREAKSNKPSYTIEDEKKFITADKIAILSHPAKYTHWIGSKDSGKTRPVVLRMIGHIESDKDAYGLALRKYKASAAVRLHTAVNNMALEIKFAGYKIPDYEKGVAQTYRMINVRSRSSNQTIEYESFDNANGLAGIEAPNLGYFPIVHIEEPVLIDDPGKIPDAAE